jgi:hypothetical protein
MGIGKVLSFPTMLDGHKPEFPINAAKLSLDQLSTFLQIESPAPFVDPADTAETDQSVIKYPTIGAFYDMIIACVTINYPGCQVSLRFFSAVIQRALVEQWLQQEKELWNR